MAYLIFKNLSLNFENWFERELAFLASQKLKELKSFGLKLLNV
jgi:hypothetical protein